MQLSPAATPRDRTSAEHPVYRRVTDSIATRVEVSPLLHTSQVTGLSWSVIPFERVLRACSFARGGK